MDNFIGIRFKAGIAARFKVFSTQIARSHSEALQLLLDAHAKLQERPDTAKSRTAQMLAHRSDRNTDRLVSIVKAIENDKIDRILGMMLVLFDHGAKRKSPPEPKLTGINSGPAREGDETGTGSNIFAVQEEKHQMRDELTRAKKDFYVLMDQKAKVVRPVLGKPYIRLNISPEEFENLKQKCKTD